MDDFLDEDGNVVISHLQTYSGGDFNWINPGYYWTLERPTAQQYHDFARARCPYSEIWMIQVQVQKSFVDGLKVEVCTFQRLVSASTQSTMPLKVVYTFRRTNTDCGTSAGYVVQPRLEGVRVVL